MTWSRVLGTGSYLPARQVHNTELESRIETSDEWIFARTGIRARHVAADGEGTVDLAAVAAARAIEAAGLKPQDIDLIVCATTTPDMVFPSTGCLLQARLGTRGAAFDVQAVCTGFLYALAVADKFVASGQARHALVVGAEVFSRLLDWSDRRTCVLFGDGAGAVVLGRSDTPGIRSTHLHSDGSQAHILQVPGHLTDGKMQSHAVVHMDGQAVFRFAVRALESVCHEVLKANGLTGADIDWLVPHQANERIILATADKLGLPRERVVIALSHQGNTSAASVPLALDAAVRDGRIQRGQRVLLEAVGGGMTWGAALIEW